MFRSFYAKLALIFLSLILLLGIGALVIAFNASGHLFDEVEQLLNREYAQSIALELQPIVEEGFDLENVKHAIHFMMVLNPMVEIYLLDQSGSVLAYFTHPEDKIIRNSINIEPLKQFIESGGLKPVLGDDPRTVNETKPFSAAKLKIGQSDGFVYVILRGQSFDRSLAMVRSSYYLRSGLLTFIIALILTIAVGFILFFYQTRRLKLLSSAAQTFEKGDYSFRINIWGSDEISDLGRAFNQMAESIETGIKKIHFAEKERRDLITNISHDLRSPITSIRGHLETIILKKNNLSISEAEELVQISIKSVKSLQNLIDELFQLANLESGHIELRKESFILTDLVQDIVLKLKGTAEESGMKIVVNSFDRVPLFSGDIGMLDRAITNLIHNALQYCPEGSLVEVIIRYVNGFEILITDNGNGVPDDDLLHIFERFYRADKSRNRGISGTGLGLAIVKQIIELHDGSITAFNNENGGATFRIQFT